MGFADRSIVSAGPCDTDLHDISLNICGCQASVDGFIKRHFFLVLWTLFFQMNTNPLFCIGQQVSVCITNCASFVGGMANAACV